MTNVYSCAPITTNTIKNHPQSSPHPSCLSPLPSAFGKCCSDCCYDSLGVWGVFVLEFHWNGITMCSSSSLALLLGIMHWNSSMLPWTALCMLSILSYCWLVFYAWITTMCPFSDSWTLELFLVWVIINKVAINICIQVSV